LHWFIKSNYYFFSSTQKSTGFSSSFGGQGQQPVSSSFVIQSNQQNDLKPVTSAVFMSSQPQQQITNRGSFNGY
jgi:hypothetical protein